MCVGLIIQWKPRIAQYNHIHYEPLVQRNVIVMQ